jgi:ubiquinone/menaquinone biosynthesis C-methylase UbiE
LTFETDYYESFWSYRIVDEPSDLKRLEGTARLIPEGSVNLIDVGCGDGVFARIVKQKFPSIQITCVDRSSAALEQVRDADEKMCCELASLPFDDQSFDCVSCLEVIEHLTVRDYKNALSELARIAKNTVIISVPYNEAIEKEVDTCPQCRTVFNRDLHLRSFNDSTFAELLSDFGFRMEESSIPVVNTHYWGFRTYYSIWRKLRGVPDRSELFMSPLCPLCGYTPEKEKQAQVNSTPAQRSAAVSASTSPRNSIIRGLVKRCWPRQTTPGYWIVGRFTRLQTVARSTSTPAKRS